MSRPDPLTGRFGERCFVRRERRRKIGPPGRFNRVSPEVSPDYRANVKSMDPNSNRRALLRVHDPKYVEPFLSGQIFLRTLRDFREKFEADVDRGDAFEGTDLLIQDVKGGTLNINDAGECPIGRIGAAARYTESGSLDVNVYCLHSFPKRDGAFEIDQRNLRMGDALIFINDPRQFIDRIKSAADLAGHTATVGRVRYIDPETHNGAMGPFLKRKSFDHQCEFRIVLKPGTGKELELSVGDLRSSTTVVQGEEIHRLGFRGDDLGILR